MRVTGHQPLGSTRPLPKSKLHITLAPLSSYAHSQERTQARRLASTHVDDFPYLSSPPDPPSDLGRATEVARLRRRSRPEGTCRRPPDTRKESSCCSTGPIRSTAAAVAAAVVETSGRRYAVVAVAVAASIREAAAIVAATEAAAGDAFLVAAEAASGASSVSAVASAVVFVFSIPVAWRKIFSPRCCCC